MVGVPNLAEEMENDVACFLFSKDIEHNVIAHKMPVHSCEDVSRVRKIPVADVIKCILVVDKSRRYFMLCLPGNAFLNLEKARTFLRTSRLSFATKEEVEAITGCKVGAVNPFFHNMKFPVIFDRCIRSKNIVDISSGSLNSGIQLHQELLVILINPQFADISAYRNPERVVALEDA